MPTTAAFSFAIAGLGAVLAGVAGILLPRGERLHALLALVVGAGVGIAVLALGLSSVGPGPDQDDPINRWMLTASIAGFASVAMSLELLRRRAGRGAGDESGE